MSQYKKSNKNVTKSKSGMECGKVVHLADCYGLRTKQRPALQANESLEWTCEECQEAFPNRCTVVDRWVKNEDKEVWMRIKKLIWTNF